MHIHQILTEHTEKAIKRFPILAAAAVKQVIPPAGIAVLILQYLFMIPVNEGMKERKLIFPATQAEGMMHSEDHICHAAQRRTADIHSRPLLQTGEEGEFIEILHGITGS